MNTQQTDVRRDQERLFAGPASLHTQDTIKKQKVSPAEPFSPPSPRPRRPTRMYWFIGITVVLLVLALALGTVVLAQLVKQPGGQVKPTPTSPPVVATTTPTSPPVATTTPGQSETSLAPVAGIVLGPRACPAGVADPACWEAIIGTKMGPQQVQSVSCANIMGTSSLQALVTDRRANAGDTLDVYVFNNINQASPTKIFQLMGLVKGDAKISGYNTVMTAQADELSTFNAGKPISAMAADLFREFRWSSSTGTLVQVAFPGLFPNLTRYQAEADQVQVNQGHQPWKLSAPMVADALAAGLLKWSPDSPTILLSGGGRHDASAVVRVQGGAPGRKAITVTLYRLEGNTNGGIWEVTDVSATGMSITSPGRLAVISSPVKVTGTGPAFEGRIGQVIVLGHGYRSLGQASAIGAIGEGQTSFSASVSYQSTFPSGNQEGVLFLSAPSNADGSIAAAVMEKVLIKDTPARAFQVLSVDLVVTPNSIAGTTCGSQASFKYTATFHILAGTPGGTINFLYTTNNGRSSPSASVTVPAGQTTVTYSFTTSGPLPADHTYPGIAQILVTSPNTVKSPAVIPTGACTVAPSQ